MTPLTTDVIRPVSGEHLLDRGGVRVTAWEHTGAPPASEPWRRLVDLSAAELVAEVRGDAARVCLGPSPAPVLLETATLLARRGRVYVYADASLRDAPALVALRAAGALVRLGVAPELDLIAGTADADGLVCLGAPGGPRGLVFGAPSGLIPQVFDALFWAHATQEALPQRGGSAGWAVPLPAPHDGGERDPLPLAGGLLSATAPTEPLLEPAQVLVCPDGVGLGPCEVLWAGPDCAAPGVLAAVAGRVCWSDLGLPHLAANPRKLTVRVAWGAGALQLWWDRSEAVRVLRTLLAPTTWELRVELPLRALGDDVILPGAGRCSVLDPQEVALGQVQAPGLQALSGFVPALPQPQALARAVHYTWEACPPLAPRGARPDKLRAAWDRTDAVVDRFAQGARRWLARTEALALAPALQLALGGVQSDLDEATELPLSQQCHRAAELWADLSELSQRLAGLASGEESKKNLSGLPRPPRLKGQTPPDEALPSVGSLVESSGTRFLAITSWSQLQEGQAEAARLGAHLVATPPPTSAR